MAHEPEILDQSGYLGPSALEAVSNAPVIRTHVSLATTRQNRSPDGGVPIQSSDSGMLKIAAAELALVVAELPDKGTCDRLVTSFFDTFNWSRFPLDEEGFRCRYQALPVQSSRIQLDAQSSLSFIGLFLAVLTLGSTSAERRRPTAESAALFWLSKKVLLLCETTGAEIDTDVCWAHLVNIRYLDYGSDRRSSVFSVGASIRTAIDLGLHRDPTEFGMDSKTVAARRILFSHLIHGDCEWSILLGRPFSITEYSTKMPTDDDLRPLGFPLSLFFKWRNELIPLLQKITDHFQSGRSSGRSGITTPRAARNYSSVLELDEELVKYGSQLPSCMAVPPATLDRSLDTLFPKLVFYRHLIQSQLFFYRILLHRPYFLKAIVNGQHPYPQSRRLCIETAMTDLRARNACRLELSPEETAQMFGSQYEWFNSAVIAGLAILISVDLGEPLSREHTREHLEHLHSFVHRLQLDGDGGTDVTTRQRVVVEAILSRIESCTQTQPAAGWADGDLPEPSPSTITWSSHPDEMGAVLPAMLADHSELFNFDAFNEMQEPFDWGALLMDIGEGTH